MEVLKAIDARHAVRDFAATPVSKDTVRKILTAATRAPSGGNGQPWELFVASGATMEAIRKGYVERAQNAPPRQPSPRPDNISAAQEAIRERMTAIRIERMQLLGLDPNDPEAHRVDHQRRRDDRKRHAQRQRRWIGRGRQCHAQQRAIHRQLCR